MIQIDKCPICKLPLEIDLEIDLICSRKHCILYQNIACWLYTSQFEIRIGIRNNRPNEIMLRTYTHFEKFIFNLQWEDVQNIDWLDSNLLNKLKCLEFYK